MPSFVGLLLDLALYNLKKRDFIAEYWMSENFIPAPYASLGHKNRAVFYERRQSMTNTKCSYGTSMSIFCIYNLKNHTFNEKERERERASKQYSFQYNSAVLLHKYGAAKRRRVLSKRSSVCRVSIPACNLIYSLSMPGVVIKPADN